MSFKDTIQLYSLVVIRWWACEPAGRHVSERKTSPWIQEEEDDRAGLGGGPAQPDIQDPSGKDKHRCHSFYSYNTFSGTCENPCASTRCPTVCVSKILSRVTDARDSWSPRPREGADLDSSPPGSSPPSSSARGRTPLFSPGRSGSAWLRRGSAKSPRFPA